MMFLFVSSFIVYELLSLNKVTICLV